MTYEEMARATGLAEWRLIWMGDKVPAEVEHVCTAPSAPSRLERLPFRATPQRGIAAARCERCRTAWVRRRE